VDHTAAYYDAVWMIAEAVTESGISTSSIANRLSNATDFAGVQGEYDRTETDTVLLVQAQPDGQRIEAARYVGGACVTCPDLWRADTSDDTVTQTETFNIGLLTTTSGGSEATGESIEQAVRLAIREINETGGIVRSSTRYTLNLTVYDTTSDASAAFQEAVDDGMQIILGPDYNGQILPNLTDAANADLVQLVSATSDQIAVNQSDDLVFQLRPTDETMVNTAAAYLLDVREIERFAFVAVRTDYGLDAADSFGDAVADGDGTLALRLEHDLEQTDFTELAQQIVDANVGAVGVWTTQPAAAALLTALESLNWDGVFMYGYLTPDYAAQFEASTVEVAGAVNWWSDAGDWASRDFAGRYAARYGAAPAPQSASYYDAVYLLAEAIATNGATSANLQNWLTNLTAFIGIQGEYRPADYDTGELTQYVYIVGSEAGDDGVLQTLARYDGTTCLNGCE
jgi:branched-chain amino acid transport system substrate-binding protein